MYKLLMLFFIKIGNAYVSIAEVRAWIERIVIVINITDAKFFFIIYKTSI